MNIINLIGRIGKDPEMLNGNSVAKFSLAVNEKYNGENKTTWFNIVAFGKIADVILKYLHKGDMVGITGKMNCSKYEKDGVNRESWDVIVSQIHFISNGNSNSNQPNVAPKSTNTDKNEFQSQESDDGVPF